MSGEQVGNFGLIEMVLVGTVTLGFGFWQLWSVNREIKADREQAQQDQEP
jgi:hypothetical protein